MTSPCPTPGGSRPLRRNPKDARRGQPKMTLESRPQEAHSRALLPQLRLLEHTVHLDVADLQASGILASLLAGLRSCRRLRRRATLGPSLGRQLLGFRLQALLQLIVLLRAALLIRLTLARLAVLAARLLLILLIFRLSRLARPLVLAALQSKKEQHGQANPRHRSHRHLLGSCYRSPKHL